MHIMRLHGTAWLVHDDDKGIVVDTGQKSDKDLILGKIGALNINIPLIVLTHTHYDHTGCVQALQKKTGAKVIVSAKESAYLRQGHTPVPKGTGILSDMLSRAAHLIDTKRREYYMPVTRDIIEVNTEMTLDKYGFDATIIPLGAHTDGSIGLKTSEYFFSGDTVFGIGHIVYPLFANFPEQIQSVWQTIINSGAKYVCPGHGRMLEITALQRRYNRRFE